MGADHREVDEHEHVYVEEQEQGGRLVLPPCIVCELSAMDALEELRRGEPMPFIGHTLDDFTDEQVITECQERGFVGLSICGAEKRAWQVGRWGRALCTLPPDHLGGGHRFDLFAATSPDATFTPKCDMCGSERCPDAHSAERGRQ